MINYEKEVIGYLNIPSIPKKQWDGKSSFENGVALVGFNDGTEGYAIAAFNAETDESPMIKKVFSLTQYTSVKKIFVVPGYMDKDVDLMDLDDASKKKAKEILQEAEELENDGVEDSNPMDKLPEWIFPEITNKEEAEAWLRSYNSTNHIKGQIPQDEETIKLRLYAIHSELLNKNSVK